MRARRRRGHDSPQEDIINFRHTPDDRHRTPCHFHYNYFVHRAVRHLSDSTEVVREHKRASHLLHIEKHLHRRSGEGESLSRSRYWWAMLLCRLPVSGEFSVSILPYLYRVYYHTVPTV